MTDRFNALVVTLEKDTRDDDAEALIAAILQLRGVAHVAGNIADLTSHVAEMRAIAVLGDRVLGVIYPKKGTP